MSNAYATKFLVLICVTGLIASAANAADDTAEPRGMWRGMMSSANRDVALRVSFEARLAKIHFNEPVSCDAPARFIRKDGDTWVYRFAPSVNGGRFCDMLVNHGLRIKPPVSSEKAMQLMLDNGRTTWMGQIEPAGGMM